MRGIKFSLVQQYENHGTDHCSQDDDGRLYITSATGRNGGGALFFSYFLIFCWHASCWWWCALFKGSESHHYCSTINWKYKIAYAHGWGIRLLKWWLVQECPGAAIVVGSFSNLVDEVSERDAKVSGAEGKSSVYIASIFHDVDGETTTGNTDGDGRRKRCLIDEAFDGVGINNVVNEEATRTLSSVIL